MDDRTPTPDANVIMRICAGGEFSRRSPLASAMVRLLVAIWLLALAGILCSGGRYWGAALLAPAALQLWIASRLTARVRAHA